MEPQYFWNFGPAQWRKNKAGNEKTKPEREWTVMEFVDSFGRKACPGCGLGDRRCHDRLRQLTQHDHRVSLSRESEVGGLGPSTGPPQVQWIVAWMESGAREQPRRRVVERVGVSSLFASVISERRELNLSV